MSHYYEYTKPLASSYSNLGSTYHGKQASMRSKSMSEYMVPDICANGPGINYPPHHDTLTHRKLGDGSGKFSFRNAYPEADCMSCQGVGFEQHMSANRPSNIPKNAFGPFSKRKCGGSKVPGCQPKKKKDDNKSEGFFGFLGL